jgi:hypothetical protein
MKRVTRFIGFLAGGRCKKQRRDLTYFRRPLLFAYPESHRQNNSQLP